MDFISLETFPTCTLYQEFKIPLPIAGGILVFTGLNARFFLKKKIFWFQWFGMVLICSGLALTELADYELSKVSYFQGRYIKGGQHIKS